MRSLTKQRDDWIRKSESVESELSEYRAVRFVVRVVVCCVSGVSVSVCECMQSHTHTLIRIVCCLWYLCILTHEVT